MRTKLVLSAILMVIGFSVTGQTLIYEDFSAGTMPPTGWTIDAHLSNWSNSPTAIAGGTAPEALFYYYPSFVGYSRLISPQLNTTGFTSLTMTFNHMLDDYASLGGYSIGVATRTGTGTWNIVWQTSPTGNIGPEFKALQINSSDVGASNFQFCLFFNGDSYNLDNWYIDNIKLSVSVNYDAAMLRLDVPSYGLGNDQVAGAFANLGLNNLVSVDVSYQVDNGTIYTTSFTGLNLSLGQTYDFVCADPLDLNPGNYMIHVWVSNANGMGNDQDPSNDTTYKELHVGSATTDMRPFFEEFTSSTCAPCANFNSTVFNPFLEEHGDEITLVKYQMYWPSPGDPYYTEEGGVRMDFYGVGYVPDLYVQGTQTSTDQSGVNTSFANALATPAFMDINAYHSFLISRGDTTVNVHLDFIPYISGSFTAYVAVIEEVTYLNVGSNGETEFHNVMMKMVPDAYGTQIDLTDGAISSLDLSASLVGTNIETMDNLLVAVWLQDDITRQVFQSAYSDSIGVGITPVISRNDIKIFPNPSTGIFYIDGLTFGDQITVMDNTGRPVMENVPITGNRIDLGTLSNGIYFLRLHAKDGMKAARISIIK